MSTVHTAAHTAAAAPRRSWIARHKILTVLLVLLAAIVAAFFVWGWPLVKWRFHRLYAVSLAEIRKAPAVIQRLGKPISVPALPLPAGREHTDNNVGEARFDFPVEGPKDKAQVVALLRMIDGKWGFTQLKLTFGDKSEIDLTRAIQQRDGDEMPPFDPRARQPDVKPPDLPVDIVLPDLPSEPGK